LRFGLVAFRAVFGVKVQENMKGASANGRFAAAPVDLWENRIVHRLGRSSAVWELLTFSTQRTLSHRRLAR
jgi:hypothetical protein